MDYVEMAKRVAKTTKNPRVKETLRRFDDKCPNCFSNRDKWTIDIDTEDNPPIIENYATNCDLVRYRCDCGEVFKKVESNKE